MKTNPNSAEHLELLYRGYRLAYEYESLPLRVVESAIAFVNPREKPDAYLSQCPETEEVKRLLEAGFRWIFSENECAIFERAFLKAPDVQSHIDSSIKPL